MFLYSHSYNPNNKHQKYILESCLWIHNWMIEEAAAEYCTSYNLCCILEWPLQPRRRTGVDVRFAKQITNRRSLHTPAPKQRRSRSQCKRTIQLHTRREVTLISYHSYRISRPHIHGTATQIITPTRVTQLFKAILPRIVDTFSLICNSHQDTAVPLISSSLARVESWLS